MLDYPSSFPLLFPPFFTILIPINPFQTISKGVNRLPVKIKGKTFYYTSEALDKAGVHESTWRRWLKNGDIEDVKTKNRNGWRLFTDDDIQNLKDFAETIIVE
ncbi:MAG: MerR family transcriptional regulator [Candidatus Lokiarchaeota archaeon]|nr:MerR family transcriptional regulator [Candidatus Lokiarchaeota archaeon]